jgi:hypothetical protein
MSVFDHPLLRIECHGSGRGHTRAAKQRDTVWGFHETAARDIIQCVAEPTANYLKEEDAAHAAQYEGDRIHSHATFQFDCAQRGSTWGSGKGGRST